MEKSKNSKNILIINDMPGYGKVALAAMLPILSNFGHSVYNLPTALVSNTLDYGKFTILDTTEYMKKSISVWKDLGFSFDCITTGFLASAEQVDIIREFIDSQRKEDLLVMTDPIMGDDGKLYNGVTEETVENMRRLIGVADVIVPNVTEAQFLTGLHVGKEGLNQEEARELVDGLLAFGPKAGPRAALFSSLGGFLGSIAWYAAAYASTSKGLTGLAAPGILGAIHPIIPGILASAAIFALCAKRVRPSLISKSFA